MGWEIGRRLWFLFSFVLGFTGLFRGRFLIFGGYFEILDFSFFIWDKGIKFFWYFIWVFVRLREEVIMSALSGESMIWDERKRVYFCVREGLVFLIFRGIFWFSWRWFLSISYRCFKWFEVSGIVVVFVIFVVYSYRFLCFYFVDLGRGSKRVF